jgi:hypothetical protein
MKILEWLELAGWLAGAVVSLGTLVAGVWQYRTSVRQRIAQSLMELEKDFRELRGIVRVVDPASGLFDNWRDAVRRSIRGDVKNRPKEEIDFIGDLDQYLRFLTLLGGLERYQLLDRDAIAYAYHYWFRTVLEDPDLAAYAAKYFKNLNQFLNDAAPDFLAGYRPDKDLRLEPGDIFLTRGRGFISKAIRVFTRGLGEPRTMVNHVGLVVEGGPLKEAEVVEALSSVVKHPLMERYGDGANDVAIYRPMNLTAEEVDEVVAAAKAEVDKPYGYSEVFLHLLDWLLLGAYFFRRLGNYKDYPICSYLVADAFEVVKKTFGVPPGAATPDDIWDFVTSRPSRYQRIRPLTRLEKPEAEGEACPATVGSG